MQSQATSNLIPFPARPGTCRPPRPDVHGKPPIAGHRETMVLHERVSTGELPVCLDGQSDKFAALGFRFGKPERGWVSAKYPPAWSWAWRDTTAGRHAHVVVTDHLGRTRAVVTFGTPATAGTFATLLLPRYVVREVDDVPQRHVRTLPACMLAIHDAGFPTDVSRRFDGHDPEDRRSAVEEVMSALARLHPRHREELAYW